MVQIKKERWSRTLSICLNLEGRRFGQQPEFCPGNNAYSIKNYGKSIFYHAGCPVCVAAEQEILQLIGNDAVEIVHLGTNKERLADAEAAGIQSVPALFTPSGNVLHINFGAALSDLK